MTSDLLTLPFQPRHYPDLGIEVSTLEDLRRRAGALLARPQRLRFCSLLVLTAGEVVQMVDFRQVPCGPGDLLFIAPEQVFQVRLPVTCTGYVIIFRPDFLPPDDDVGHVLVANAIHGLARYHASAVGVPETVLAECAALLHSYRHYDDHPLSARILSYQLRIILTRLARVVVSPPLPPVLSPPHAALMQQFRTLVEQQYRYTRALAAYAHQLHCAPRTLQRVVAAASGQTGKAYIDARVMLEAKRILAHTNDSVGAIAALLGFSETTNFVKYFQRHAGLSPERFRRCYR